MIILLPEFLANVIKNLQFKNKIMKNALMIMLLFVATNVAAQKTFNVTEIRYSSAKKPGWKKVEQTQMTINITDHLFKTTAQEKSFSYEIVKKADEYNFTISDKQEKYKIRIGQNFIEQEMEEGLLTYVFN